MFEEPGTEAFLEEHAALASAADRGANSFLGALEDYIESQEYQRLAPKTREDYANYLTLIADEFGALSLGDFDERHMRRRVRKWRDGMADTPRKADMAISVLRRVLNWCIANGDLSINVATNTGRLHKADRSGEIWTEKEISAFLAKAPAYLQDAFNLARYTGLRRSDLVRVTKGDVREGYLELVTSKTGARVITPLVKPAQSLVERLRGEGEAPTLLSNSLGAPMTPDVLSRNFHKIRLKTKTRKRWHDLRGTAATEFMRAGLDDREIGEIMGWSRQSVAQIRARYISRQSIVMAAVEKLNRHHEGKKAS